MIAIIRVGFLILVAEAIVGSVVETLARPSPSRIAATPPMSTAVPAMPAAVVSPTSFSRPLLRVVEARRKVPIEASMAANPSSTKFVPEQAVSIAPPSPISPKLVAQLIRACADSTNAVTQAAVVAAESDGDAWVLHDDNDDRIYRPTSYDVAVSLANTLIATDAKTYGSADRGVDIGIGQISSANFKSLGVDAATMLDPCANLRVSSRIIAQAYNAQYAALSTIPNPQRDREAMRRALQVYNSGQPFGDEQYVRNVLVALHSPIVAHMRLLEYAPPPIVPIVPVVMPIAARAHAGSAMFASTRPTSATTTSVAGGRFAHADVGGFDTFSSSAPATSATPVATAAPTSQPTDSSTIVVPYVPVQPLPTAPATPAA